MKFDENTDFEKIQYWYNPIRAKEVGKLEHIREILEDYEVAY